MSLAELLYANPIYRVFLAGPAPRRLTCLPPPAWLGDQARGAATLVGTLRCAGQPIRVTPPDWRNTGLTAEALTELHSFRWLDDLAAAGGPRATEMARAMIDSWIDEHSDWSPVVWAPHVLGARIATWLTHARLLSRGESDPLGPRILGSLARQMRHLARVADTGIDGVARLIAIRGLIYGAACGLGPTRRLDRTLRLLSREVDSQILADGGHIARCPAVHIEALAALVDIRDMLVIAQCVPPVDLVAAIDRMAPITRFYRHGDGRLALFNGTVEGNGALIDAVLVRANANGRPPDSAPYAGFERLAADQTLIVMDTGVPPPAGFGANAHAGTLSFEMSYGRERLIVNCGALKTMDPAWRKAQGATAAHSTITIDDTNSAELGDADRSGRRPSRVEAIRESAEGDVWVTAGHDGYALNFGLVHQRRIYLSKEGRDLRGEDTVSGSHHGQYVARFHLHPDVRASMVQNGAAALLQLPGGAVWRFQAAGGLMGLEESVYMGRGERRRTEQIVISGKLDGSGVQVKWALKQVPQK